MELDNPYLNEMIKNGYKVKGFKDEIDLSTDLSMLNLMNEMNLFAKRRYFCRKYAFAIPDTNVIKEIAALSPIVEVGAGSGYWSWCLRQLGCEVTPYDDFSWKTDWYAKWTNLRIGNHKKLHKFGPEVTLLLVWPPYETPMAYNCLRSFSGHRLVVIGEGPGGCTGDGAFFDLLEKEWEEKKIVDIPQWWGIHDAAFFYTRKVFNERQR